jgi:hypothetical protein
MHNQLKRRKLGKISQLIREKEMRVHSHFWVPDLNTCLGREFKPETSGKSCPVFEQQ